ncbi:uncharacterized protein TNCV_3540161 [Trichonephila clavipes]|nr:uncharacterized protein TNCV_3540161 [Trichonephila clavipes]
MSSSPVPLNTRRVGQRCTLNLLRAETSSRWCGVVARRGGCHLKCRPRHLTMVQNYVVRRKSPRVAEQCDVNIQSIKNFLLRCMLNHIDRLVWHAIAKRYLIHLLSYIPAPVKCSFFNVSHSLELYKNAP